MKSANLNNHASLRTFTYLLFSLYFGIFLSSCDILNPDDDDNLPPTDTELSKYYALCEGTFTQANASLWSFDETYDSLSGPLVWNTTDDQLGDVGQSLTLDGHTLYIVMNNSHEIRILDLENGPTHIGDIALPNASPRFMAIQASQNRAFVSSWNLDALLVIDLGSNTIQDTILLSGSPEEIIIDGDNLYTSLTKNADWSPNNQVVQMDISATDPVITSSYTVLAGPGSMALSNGILYVTSVAYDANWIATTGTSSIDLTNGTVLTVGHGAYSNYSADIDIINGVPYRVYGNSIVPLNNDLSFNSAGSIGNVAGIYSFSVQNDQVIIGTSDYTAVTILDPIFIYSTTGDSLASMDVAAYPGDVIFYDSGQTE